MNAEESPQFPPSEIPEAEAANSPTPEATGVEPPGETASLTLEAAGVTEMAENPTPADQPPSAESPPGPAGRLAAQVAELEHQKQELEREIQSLQARKAQLLAEQMAEVQATLKRLVRESLQALEERKQELELSIEQLERRRDRIREEMRTTFAGVSRDLAVKVQGFKDYLVGSLQDLAAAADQLELPNLEPREQPEREEPRMVEERPSAQTQVIQKGFQEQGRRIHQILEQYRTQPDYYGPPWQLRRTFEPIHVERVENWFFTQGGRGAIRSMGSRLQNILIASAIVAVLNNLYGDRCRTLILADTPERLGEWRRGLQDCLGISRSDFGPERGIALFESPGALVQKAERLSEQKQLPLVIFDEGENQVNLSLLQFPLWLAFAPDPQQTSSYFY